MNNDDTTRGPPPVSKGAEEYANRPSFEERQRLGYERAAARLAVPDHVYRGVVYPARRVGPQPVVYTVRHHSLPKRLLLAFLQGLHVRAVWVSDRVLELIVKALRIMVYAVVLPTLAWVAMLSWQNAQQATSPADAARIAGKTAASTVGGFLSGIWDAIAGPDEDEAADNGKSNPLR